jgi:hypothetical protein
MCRPPAVEGRALWRRWRSLRSTRTICCFVPGSRRIAALPWLPTSTRPFSAGAARLPRLAARVERSTAALRQRHRRRPRTHPRNRPPDPGPIRHPPAARKASPPSPHGAAGLRQQAGHGDDGPTAGIPRPAAASTRSEAATSSPIGAVPAGRRGKRRNLEGASDVTAKTDQAVPDQGNRQRQRWCVSTPVERLSLGNLVHRCGSKLRHLLS